MVKRDAFNFIIIEKGRKKLDKIKFKNECLPSNQSHKHLQMVLS